MPRLRAFRQLAGVYGLVAPDGEFYADEKTAAHLESHGLAERVLEVVMPAVEPRADPTLEKFVEMLGPKPKRKRRGHAK